MHILGKEMRNNLEVLEKVFDVFKLDETEAGLIEASYKTIE
jgi:hypothetical protein